MTPTAHEHLFDADNSGQTMMDGSTIQSGGFIEWGSFLKNDHLTEALIDRLTETSHVFNMKECVGIRPRRGADESDHELGADQ